MTRQLPHLDYRQDFETALKGYALNDEAVSILAITPLVLIAGPSSVGRDTIVQRLVESGKYYDIITTTTRPPRENNGILERDGVEYYFRPEVYVLEEVQAGRLIGPAIIHNQQVSGVSIQEFEKAQKLQKIAVTDLDPVGTLDVAALKSDVVVIFVLPPSFEEWLARINRRGAPAPEELKRRLEGAVKEYDLGLAHSDIFTYVVNDDLEKAVAEVDDIAHGRHHPANEATAQQLARQTSPMRW